MDDERKREIWKQASARYRKKHVERVRENERKSAKKNYPKNKARIVANNRKRRALLSGAKEGETVYLETVAQRDGWRCHICRVKVTRNNWSLDHLIPLSRGGPHSYQNVSLAHNICNKRRWVDRLPAQLRLFG